MTDVYGVRVEIDSRSAQSSLANLRTSLLSANQSLLSLQSSVRGISPGLASGVNSISGAFSAFASTLTKTTSGIALLSAGIAGLVVLLGVKLFTAIKNIVRPFVEAADKVTMFQSRLKILSGTEVAFNNLVKSVERFNVSLEAGGSVAQRFIMMRNEIGLTVVQAQALADNFVKIGVISGASAEAFQIAALQFSQALGSGRLQGDELRSIMEAMPFLGKVLAENIGTGVGNLKKMGAEGKLTSDIIANGILKATKQLDDLYRQMPVTMTMANQKLATQVELLYAYIGRLTGVYDLWVKISSTVADYVKKVRAALGDLQAMGGPLEKLQKAEAEISELKNKRSDIQANPSYTYLGIYWDAQKIKEINEQIENLEKKRSDAIRQLDIQRKEEDIQTIKDLNDIEEERVKKFTGNIRELSRELSDALGDLSLYDSLDKRIAKVVGRFDELRKKVNELPGATEKIKAAMNANLDAFERQQITIETVTFGAEKEREIQKKINELIEKRPQLLKDVSDASKMYGIPRELILGVMATESNFSNSAVSNKGASGLMQLMPATARDMGVKDIFDQRQNIFGGVKYLAEQLKDFQGNLDLALAAYNAGPAAVRKAGGIPQFKDTLAYIPKVKEAASIIQSMGDTFDKTMEGFRMEALKEGAANLNTASNAADKFKKNVEQLVLYSEVYPEKIAPGEELAREILKAKDAYLDAIDPNRKFVEGILQQEDAAKGKGLTIRAEQIDEIKKRAKDAADQLDPFNTKTAEYQRQIEKSVATTAYYEQLREVGVQLKEVARAQEQFTIENEIAIKVVASGAASEKEYQRWLYVRKSALEDLAEPNKKMLDDLEAELAIYRRFASSDDGERRIQQAMAIRSALASVNRADPNYETTVDRVKEMTVELEAFKEQMSLVNNQAELFKNAATGIYETWTGAFESIFDKGLQGFKDMKDQILALFKKLLAQMIATAAARPVMVPLIQTMGETFGMQGTARELIKQFGGPIPATAGTMAATPVGGGIPLARQANDLPMAAGMAPGWAYGAAGLGGYLAGNYLGGGSPMSQFGGAAGALGGAFVGGKYGSLLGTAITPGIGTALGAIVGGLAGTLLGSLFGGGGDKQPSPRARFGQGRGGQFSTTTPFGIAGFSELRVEHGMDQELWNQGREFLATIRDFEESIAQVLDPAEIQRVKDALANFKSDSTDFAGILKNRIAVIADAINLSYRTLLGDTSKMDTKAIAERLGILKELENALTRTIDDIAEAAAIQSGGYDIQVADTLSKLKEEFDRWTGSTPQLQTINDLVEDRYQLELDRLAEIKSVTEDLRQGTESLLQDLERAGMTQSELLADWRGQMTAAMQAVSGLSDPAKIRETVASYQEASQAAFRILSDLLSQFDSARASIAGASLSRTSAIRRGGMASADQIASLQSEFVQRQAALQAATTPGEVTDAFNDLQTTLNDWLSVEQNLLNATEGQTRTLEDLTQAIDDAKKTISQSAIEQARSIRYSVLKPEELISALQSDLATQQSALQSATTPESIAEAYTAIQNTLQEWMQAEQAAIQAANAELQTAEELQKTVDDLRKGLREFIDDLKISDISPLKPSEKLAEAQQQYMNLLNKAKVGDTEALNTVGNAAQEYLNQAREFYASSPNYTAIFKSVTDTLTVLQQQFTANTATSDEESRLRSLAETFAQRLESVSQDAMNSLATLSVTQSQSGISALAETFAQRFELVAQDALNRLASLQAEQLGSIGNLNELADQFKSGISEMTRLAQDQLKSLQDSALARYQEFTAALDETLRDGAGVLSESLRAAFDAGAAAIADAVSGQFAAASQPTATIIPFPTRVAAAANVATTENQAELEQKLDAVVEALGRIGVIVQVSTKEQTRELIQSRSAEHNSGTAATTKQVF